MEKEKEKFGTPINFQMIDMKEFSQYMEAISDDITKAFRDLQSELGGYKAAELNIPDKFYEKTNALMNVIGELNKKKFEMHNMPDFDGLQKSIKDLNSVIKSFKLPAFPKITFPNLPEQKAPVVNVDIKGFREEMQKFLEVIKNTMLQAELTNLDQMPMILSQANVIQRSEATPIIHNKTLTLGSTWYPIDITAPTKAFIIQCLTGYDMDVRFSSGASDPFWAIKSGAAFSLDGYTPTIYVRSAQAGVVAQVVETH